MYAAFPDPEKADDRDNGEGLWDKNYMRQSSTMKTKHLLNDIGIYDWFKVEQRI